MANDIALFGETNFRNKNVKFGIKPDDRRRHMYVIGKTGMGKTTLLENMVAQDIQAGRGVAVVDPHGEFAEKMLDYVPGSRVNDVIYFNPADSDWPIAFNVMEQVAQEHRHVLADGLVEVFRKLWAESWGPRLEYVLRNAILSLLEYEGSTLLGIMRILVDKEYRKVVVEQLRDPVLKSFWINEFARYHQQFMVEAIAPIQNKVGQFLTSPLVRNIVGQTKTAIDLRQAMDEGKILILNLAKGRIGEGSSRLLGAMMITKLQLAAMSRVDVPEEERKDFYLYVDEFQNFATVSFVNILSEARKYRLDLVLAHQYIEQLEEEVPPAVFGNVGTLVVFRVGATDAEFLEKEFAPEFMMSDLVNLAKYNIYLKLMIDGVASKGFSAATLPPPQKQPQSHREEIIRISRERYATPRSIVEEKIDRWSLQVLENVQATAAEAQTRKREDLRPMFDAKCAICATATRVPFEPDGVRPIYCEKCLGDIRAGRKEPVPPQRSEPRPFGGPPRREQHREEPRHARERFHDRDRFRARPAPPASDFRRAAPAVREPPKPISLKEALEKSPPPDKSDQSNRSDQSDQSDRIERRERKPPDLSGLREILGEALRDVNHNMPSEEEQRRKEKKEE